MKAGHESQTAVMVCAARAAAHGRSTVAAFSDSTALALLPQEARKFVERFRTGVPPKDLRERIQRNIIEIRSKMMVARTVAIDNAIRKTSSPQVVILGAGLDGRAWRMPELADATVFEVDHPDSQRRKQERTASIKPYARMVCFVPVDFTRDRLGDALASAGHDPEHQTTWIWEGVVMYLHRVDIEATLKVIESRSAPKSRLIVVYQNPSITRKLAGLFLSLIGEPFRSAFTTKEMQTMLAGFGFAIVEDDDLASIAANLSSGLEKDGRVWKPVRIATAEKR